MQTPVDPVETNWYQDLDQGHTFKVMAVDDNAIAIQHYDGTVENIDRDSWNALNLAQAERPVDWTGPMDNVVDDSGHEETGVQAADDVAAGRRRT